VNRGMAERSSALAVKALNVPLRLLEVTGGHHIVTRPSPA
jgi:hypothetical protein